jgi:hypothetical protein
MPFARCNICRKKIELPQKIEDGAERKVICVCGATAELMVRKRTGMVQGLRGPFFRHPFQKRSLPKNAAPS